MDTLDKIISLLERQGKTQKELTEYLGVQNTVFTKWKAGSNKSYLKHISKIAEFFGVSTDFLLSEAKHAGEMGMGYFAHEREMAAGIVKTTGNWELVRLVLAASKMTDEEVAKIVQTARTFYPDKFE